MNTTKEIRYNLVRLPTGKGETVPEYLRDISLQEVFNYYYNWHPADSNTPVQIVKEWYSKARGWTWEEV